MVCDPIDNDTISDWQSADKICPPPVLLGNRNRKNIFTTQTTSNLGVILNHCDEKVLVLSMFLIDCAYRKNFDQKWAKIGYLILEKICSIFCYSSILENSLSLKQTA